MFSAHSKDNGSPTSVAHKLDDQTDSVVVRRDELVFHPALPEDKD